MAHKHNARLTPWTFGYKPETRSECLGCGAPLLWTVGAKRMYWRIDAKVAGNKCEVCGRHWVSEHICSGVA
jgi:hypothetical protein